jgi:hypothetical protein
VKDDLMPPCLDNFLYYFVGAMIPCNALFGFTMDAKGIAYSAIPATLRKRINRNALVLLSQAVVATILIAHELWQINLLYAIESTIFGVYEMRLL